MTAARAPIAAAAKAQVETWKTLGATSGAQRALALGRHGPDLARAVLADLSPADLILLHQGAAPRGRFQTSSQPLSDLAQETPGAFDLILVDGVLEEGDLSDVRNRARNLHRLLAPGGVLAATIETLAAPLEGEARPFDILLFPHLARAGDMGETAQTRPPLSASAWRALLQATGFEITGVHGIGDQTLPQDFIDAHGARLAAYDAGELASGRLALVARKGGSS